MKEIENIDIDIYFILDKDGSQLHREVCRVCAEQFLKNGFDIEFDGHLYKYTYVKDGVSYYADGSDDEDPETTCPLCDGCLISEEKEPLISNHGD
jgi:hypothetical protein